MNIKIPPVLGVFRLNCPPVKENIGLVNNQLIGARIIHSGLKFSTSKLVQRFGEHGSHGAMETQEIKLPVATYLTVEVIPHADDPHAFYEGYTNAIIDIAFIAGILELVDPAIISEKVFEGRVNIPGQYVTGMEGPMTLTSKGAATIEEKINDVLEVYKYIDKVSKEDKNRLMLVCRWFMKGHDTPNSIDKFLAWFISLEIFPCQGSADAPRLLRDFIHTHINGELKPGYIKSAMELGRMSGARADIVHDGLCNIPNDRTQEFNSYIEKLESLVRVSIKHLAGMEYNGELDKWLLPPA